MEKLTPKHNHTLTDILKVAIFGIILIMPFLVYSPTALYYGFNEHAVSQTTVTEGGYEVQNKYETNEVSIDNEYTTLVNNNIYKLSLDNGLSTTIINEGPIGFKYINYEDTMDNTLIEFNNNLYESLILSFDTTYEEFYIVNQDSAGAEYPIENTYIYCVKDNWTEWASNFYDYDVYLYESDYIPKEYIWNDEVEVTKDITQMMSQNWQEMWTTPLFNWTNTSILKQGLDNFTGVFGVTDTSCYTNLVAYELIFVAIYIVIDIVLKMFEWLTHMIGNK